LGRLRRRWSRSLHHWRSHGPPCDVIVDRRIGDAQDFCANAANGTFPGCLTTSQPFCSLGVGALR
jgi:hypothetical protein